MLPLSSLWQGMICIILFAIPVVYSRPSCSDENPCKYGECDVTKGQCVNCPANRTGHLCEILHDICSMKLDKCNRAHSVCRALDNDLGYKCYCDQDASGTFCEIIKNPCLLSNNNTCVEGICQYAPSETRGFRCICSEKYTGDNCDTQIDLCNEDHKPGYCVHATSCNASVCTCKEGYGGQRCDRGVPLMNEYLLVEEGGFQSCPIENDCAKKYNNGVCDPSCDTAACLYDGFDCEESRPAPATCSASCWPKYNDTVCNEECNIFGCNYDGGDCRNKEDEVDTVNLCVLVAAPPDVLLHQLQRVEMDISAHLHSLVTVSREADNSDSIYAWDRDKMKTLPNRDADWISLHPDFVNATVSSVCFDIHITECKNRKLSDNSSRCFDDIYHAVAYMNTQLRSPVKQGALPMTHATWRNVRTHMEDEFPWMENTKNVIFILCLLLLILLLIVISLCIINVIIRTGKRRYKEINAPIWDIPNDGSGIGTYVANTSGCQYMPDSPPSSPDSGNPKEYMKRMESQDLKKYQRGDIIRPIAMHEDGTLLRAVQNMDIVAVKRMIESLENIIDAVDDAGLGPLHHAISNNDIEMLQLLINSRQFDIFDINDAGQSPLVYCSRVGHPDLVCLKLLTKAIEEAIIANASRTIDRIDGDDIERQSIRRVPTRIVKPLKDERDLTLALVDHQGRNSVHYATLNNNVEHIKYLHTVGSNVNLLDLTGDAPLHLAARDGILEAAMALVKCGADIYQYDSMDRTPLMVAHYNHQTHIINYLTYLAGTETPTLPRSVKRKKPNQCKVKKLPNTAPNSTAPNSPFLPLTPNSVGGDYADGMHFFEEDEIGEQNTTPLLKAESGGYGKLLLTPLAPYTEGVSRTSYSLKRERDDNLSEEASLGGVRRAASMKTTNSDLMILSPASHILGRSSPYFMSSVTPVPCPLPPTLRSGGLSEYPYSSRPASRYSQYQDCGFSTGGLENTTTCSSSMSEVSFKSIPQFSTFKPMV